MGPFDYHNMENQFLRRIISAELTWSPLINSYLGGAWAEPV